MTLDEILDHPPREIGRIIRHWRQNLDITPDELRDLSMLSIQSIRRIEWLGLGHWNSIHALLVSLRNAENIIRTKGRPELFKGKREWTEVK